MDKQKLKKIFAQTLQKRESRAFVFSFASSLPILWIHFRIKHETGLKFNTLTLELFIIKIGMLMQ